MYARIYDKKSNRYYKSIRYCEINRGYYRQYVVVNPYTRSFELVDYLDKCDRELKPLVEIIQDDRKDWVSVENALLLKYQASCKNRVPEFLRGYPDVCENFEFLSLLLEKKSLSARESGIALRSLSDTGEWHYIQTQEDANEFMNVFAGFHDATLEKLCYEQQDRSTKVTATFDNSGWFGIVELCFEGVLAVNIRPAKENQSREILEATLMIQEETVLWTDWNMEAEESSVDGSYMKALSLKWRKIG